MTDDVQRDLGRFEAQLAAGDERMDRIESKIDGLTTKLEEIAGYANRAKGAWGFVMVAGALGAAIAEGVRLLVHK